jgi:sphingolipid delta-4 desaturase
MADASAIDVRGETPHGVHRRRRAAILAARPEVKALYGRCPDTAWRALAAAAAQFAIAAALIDRPWWWALLAALFVGAFIAHYLNVVIHECTHNLVLGSTGGNKAMAIVANLPAVVPTAMAFRYFHLLHHRFLSEPRLDADVALAWEAKLVGRQPWRKLLWLLALPLVYGLIHPLQVRRRMPFDGWVVANAIVVICVAVAVLAFLGWVPLLYLGVSTYLAVGPHPTGAHILQEHIIFSGSYETASYYGPVNRISCNHGCHVEHHDFANIPGPRLGRLRAMAPEHYVGRFAHRSRLATLWQFVWDPEVTLDRRIVAAERPASAAT